MLKQSIVIFINGMMVSTAIVLVMNFIGYIPPNLRVFNMVDLITFTNFFENRIYDNWIMIGFIISLMIAIDSFFEISKKLKKNDK